MSVLFFKPIPKYTIWGTDLVKDYFNYNEFSFGVGQAWAFSAQKEESTVCVSDPYRGRTLYDLWKDNQELFGFKKDEFPVIISLVGPADDLSIQVHPDKNYAKTIGYNNGKNEAWYFIEADEDADIVYGHKAKDKNDLNKYIENDKWYELIDHLKVKKDDFVYLPAGLLHALKKGSIVYEIQQSTDITYRFFDYNRVDDHGNKRELHINEAVDCLSYDKELMKNDIKPKISKYNTYTLTEYISNDSFTVSKLEVGGVCDYKNDNYQLATVIRGSGSVDESKLSVGDNFLIPINSKIKLSGQMTIMMTTK